MTTFPTSVKFTVVFPFTRDCTCPIPQPGSDGCVTSMPGSKNSFRSCTVLTFLGRNRNGPVPTNVGEPTRLSDFHDLISPIGTINNGKELLALTGQSNSDHEVSLIPEGCKNGSDIINFFRITFSQNAEGQKLSAERAQIIIETFLSRERKSLGISKFSLRCLP